MADMLARPDGAPAPFSAVGCEVVEGMVEWVVVSTGVDSPFVALLNDKRLSMSGGGGVGGGGARKGKRMLLQVAKEIVEKKRMLQGWHEH